MSLTGSYILPEELPAFYDSRRLCHLASDVTGTPCSILVFTANPTLTDPNDLTARSRIEMLALSVSGQIDAAAQNGRKYQKVDLEALAAAGTKGGVVLKRMAADLLFGELVSVRGYHGDQVMQMAPRYEVALEMLNALANGDMVFDIDYALDASVPSIGRIGNQTLRSSEFIPFFGRWE